MKVNDKEKRRLMRLMVLPFLFACVFVQSLPAQDMGVTGKVTEASTGLPVAGVTVLIEGTSTGTVTDIDGAYRIFAKPGQTLTFSFMGYHKETVVLGNSTTVNVPMRETAHTIDDIVVMGYGANVSKVDAIGAVATVSAKQIEKRVPVNIFDALRGEMAGVRITSNSGAPGDGVAIRVRGITTFENEGVSPLYVVDGFIVDDISNINVNDVESINVLKDAASAAIYGAHAASGVVMVTTKSGKPGKTKITVNYTQKFGYISNTIPQVNRKEAEIMESTIQSYGNRDQFAWIGTQADSCSLTNSVSNYYQDLITQTAITSQFNVSASGGSDKMQYNLSAGYLWDRGVILTSLNQRANVRIKTDYQPNKTLRFTTNVALTYTDTDAAAEANIFYNSARRMPQTLLYWPTDGTYIAPWATYPSKGKRNPMVEIYERNDNTMRHQATISQQMIVNILPNLTFTGNAKANYYFQEREQFNSAWTVTDKANYEGGQNSLTLTDRMFKNYSLEGFFNFTETFKKDHHFAAMAGSSIEYQDVKQTLNSGTYLISDNLLVPQASDIVGNPRVTGVNRWSSASFFGRASYDYKKRYMVSAILRYDGSSRFGKDNKWGAFPSVQFGWRFSDYLAGTRVNDLLSGGKLRISWGITGNDRIGDFDAIERYGASQANGYRGSVGIVQLSTPGNPILKWEQTQETNFGLDLSFLKNRLNVETDFYIQKTSDLLDDEPLPTELGYSTIRVNAGEIRNVGWEVAVSAYPVDMKDWQWMTSITWSRNQNEVRKLAGGGAGRIYSDFWWLEQGVAPGQFYGFKQTGVYAYDASNAYTADYTQRLIPVFQRDDHDNVMFDWGRNPIVTGYTYQDGTPFVGTPSKMRINGSLAQGGDVIWDDTNRDGNITNEDKQILGNGYPSWFMGWNNTVSWKNLSLSFSFYYSHGGYLYNSLLYDLSKYGDNTSAADPRAVTQGWRYQGQLTDWHIPGANNQNGRADVDNNRSLSSFYLEKASYLRLQDVRLSYSFPSKVVAKMFLSSLQTYVYGGNLLTWTNYRGYDPEINTGSVLSPGRDNQKYPRKREIGFGLVCGF